MDSVQWARIGVRLYVALLVAGGLFTAVWLFGPDVVTSPMVASAWFTVGAFGVIVLLLLLLVHVARRD